jgi:signal transduction histidine kinase/ligand-binding sensor domain-containing protein
MRRILLAAGLSLTFCPCAVALNPALDVSQYIHTAWRVRDGFPRGEVRAIVQTPDGYLWLGTEYGLLRFDGVRAVPFQAPANQHLPSDNITNLLVSRDGSLWIATNKGLATWKDGILVQHEKLAGSVVGLMVEDRQRSVWVTKFVTSWALCEIRERDVTCHGENGGRGAGSHGLFVDSADNVWVGVSDGVWRWKPGVPAFYALQREENGIRAFAEDRDGSLLFVLAGSIRRMAEGKSTIAHPFPSTMDRGQPTSMLRDRDGGLWIATASSGLMHVHGGITDVFSRNEGLSGDGIDTIFEDREGTVWVGTLDGLDRFREPVVASYSPRQGLSNPRVSSVAVSRDGSVWFGTFDGLNQWQNGRVTVYRDGLRVPINSMLEDSRGRMWASTSEVVGYLEANSFVAVDSVASEITRAIVEDRRKTMWIAKSDRGLLRFAHGKKAVEKIPWTAFNHQDPAMAVAADTVRDGLWLGFYLGGVVYFADGRVRESYGVKNGLADGMISSLYVDSAGTVWVAAEGGLSRIKDGRATTMSRKNGLPCDEVGWIVEDVARSFWLGMTCGLAHITRNEIDAWSETHPVRATLFDSADGVRMFSIARYYTAPAARASDGKIWFTSPDGASVIDAKHLPFNTLPPPVHVEQVIADRKVYIALAGSAAALRLPALTNDIEIDYTALSFVAPEKVRFRYKLEGHDRDWQEVGTRRQAFYTNLRPRGYRFRVMAANNSGVWNEAGAAVDFVILSAYYQTTWFAVLSIGLILGVAWTAHRVRLRIVEKHQREIGALNERLMKAQEQERIRIAGELHDGVMQEMLAATMMLGAAKRRIPDDVEAKAKIDKVQDKLIRVGTDIRRLSHDLHPPVLQEAGLPQALQICCEEFSAASGIPVYCEADDRARDLSRGAALALFRIVQEALGNAAKHASATHITVRLTRSVDNVLLVVSDDGVGFDGGRFNKPGGLGLVMMRERATQLNGTFEFDSAPGRGTTIKVIIPFR